MKTRVFVTFMGRPMTGKTGLMKLFIEALKANNFEVETHWGIDGEPQTSPEFDQKRLRALANKSKVIVNEIQARRLKSQDDDPTEVLIEVLHSPEKGYGVRLTICGFPLESWFGDFSVSKERARTVAARLSAEFDLEYQDKIPREYDWRQPQ